MTDPTTSSVLSGSDPPSTLEGTVLKILFTSDDSTFCVLRLQVPRGPTETVVGPLVGAKEHELLRISGHWVHDKRWGRQFKAVSYLSVQPSTLPGMERYLASGLIPGVGKVMSQRLVARFGLETLEIIERAPHRLTEVEGIGKIRAQRLAASWNDQREIRQVMLFLQTHGISTHHAMRIYRHYGEHAIRLVTENPYRLTDIHGFGFLSADNIARSLGVDKDSPQRAAAGTLHALWEATLQGHVYLAQSDLVLRAIKLLERPPEAILEAIRILQGGERIVVEFERASEEEIRIYPRRLFEAEIETATRIAHIHHHGAITLTSNLESSLDSLEKTHGLSLAPRQREAIENSLRNKITVITGGPGTGKTTLIRTLVELLSQKKQRVALAAPTGRAAKRLSEATGRPASTLHRLLAYSPQTNAFERDAENPLEVDVLIVDEVSMVDSVLACSLLQAVPDETRLVLVGDADQLPSVGPGSVLAELLASGLQSVRLTEVFRQDRESLIVANAHRILRGELPRQSATGRESDFFFIGRDSPEDTLETVLELMGDRIPQGLGLKTPDDVQVLAPMRKGILGINNLNVALQGLFNPRGVSVGPTFQNLRIGDKVMQIKNNYELEVFNGDLGKISGLDEETGDVLVTIDGRSVSYEPTELDQLDLAYACSIHKSQGSEYPGVLIVLHRQHYVMLQRNLLYTALTRGKRLALIVGSRQATRRAVENATTRTRNSSLADKILAAKALYPA